MFNDQPPPSTSAAAAPHAEEDNEDVQIRDIHALTSPQPPPVTANRNRRGEANWETTSQRSASIASEASSSSENFTSMSREFNALVIAGAEIGDGYRHDRSINEAPNNLSRIGEEEDTTPEVETNPLAIVPDGHPFDDLTTSAISRATENRDGGAAATREISLHMVKKEEVETKISAWQNAKIAKINNRYKREDAVISGWEREQVQKASSWMKKIERKLEEKRAKALEKMENEVAKAHRKAEERRASAEAKRGTKVAKVIEISNLMRAVGRPPAKRSFF
ncbi:remorin [Cucumis melo var. makuwa]|uniref:Remorin n=3 Tax=Cucumis melo TaxID=3656 RepID=A0A5A7UFF5_CUCMM|nr:remorin [Cucumis melo subsp. melo]KAA0053924.1 remorin [Cucumis melo var. makuwa]TYK25480.1 remorin [Cucumis melo var. makuwa]